MSQYLKLIALAGLLFYSADSVQPAQAGTIILEGSDAIGSHSIVGNPFAITYRDQAWRAIGGPDPRAIAVIGSALSGASLGSATHPIMQFPDIPSAGPLSNYVALYFLATNGCCTENDSLPAGNNAAISAYLAAGGTVMIEDYTGGAAWDFAIGTGGIGNAHVAGLGGGVGGAPSCDDGETVTRFGTLNGFSQPGPMGCWTHQGYDAGFFGGLGFTLNFFNSPKDYPRTPTGGGFSSLLSTSRTTAMVPEPASIVLLCLGFLIVIGYGPRAKSRKCQKDQW